MTDSSSVVDNVDKASELLVLARQLADSVRPIRDEIYAKMKPLIEKRDELLVQFRRVRKDNPDWVSLKNEIDQMTHAIGILGKEEIRTICPARTQIKTYCKEATELMKSVGLGKGVIGTPYDSSMH